MRLLTYLKEVDPDYSRFKGELFFPSFDGYPDEVEKEICRANAAIRAHLVEILQRHSLVLAGKVAELVPDALPAFVDRQFRLKSPHDAEDWELEAQIYLYGLEFEPEDEILNPEVGAEAQAAPDASVAA